MTWMNIATYFVALNLLGFLLFAFDKQRARSGKWRIAESTLLFVAFIGGSLGSKFGQYWTAHKTRKQPFAIQLNFIVVLHLAIALVLALPVTRQPIFDVISAL